MDIGEEIKAARKSVGLTQKQLGEKLGVSAAMIAQYETGKRIPKTPTFKKIIDTIAICANDAQSEVYTALLGKQWSTIDYSTDQIVNTKSKKNEILFFYNRLNKTGQQKAIEQVEMLTKIPEYRADPQPSAAESPDTSDQDE